MRFPVFRKLEGTIKRTSEKAYCFTVDGTDYWIPKSQTTGDVVIGTGDKLDSVMVSEWILKEKGLLHLAVEKILPSSSPKSNTHAYNNVNGEREDEGYDSHYQVDQDSTIKNSTKYNEDDIPF